MESEKAFVVRFFVCLKKLRIFAAKIKFATMTTIQLNAELYRAMSEIADDETLLAKVLKYVKKLAAKREDPALMTKDEFFRRVDEAKQGPSKRFDSVEDLDKYIRSL